VDPDDLINTTTMGRGAALGLIEEVNNDGWIDLALECF
jgi:hypothetical protein